jgi:hypothetical protein
LNKEPYYVSTTKKNNRLEYKIDFVPTNEYIYLVNYKFFNDIIDALNYSLSIDDEKHIIHELPFNEKAYDKDIISLELYTMTPFKWLFNLILDYRIYNKLNDQNGFKEAFHILKMSDFLQITLIKELIKKYPIHENIFSEKIKQTQCLQTNHFSTLQEYINFLYPVSAKL